MAERIIKVPPGVGLHARPAAVFVQSAARTPLHVTVAKVDGDPVNAKSILSVLALDIRGEDEIVLRADGEGAEAALDDLVKVVAAGDPHA